MSVSRFPLDPEVRSLIQPLIDEVSEAREELEKRSERLNRVMRALAIASLPGGAGAAAVYDAQLGQYVVED